MKFTKVIRRLLHLLYFLGAPVFISCFFLSSACFADSQPITINLESNVSDYYVCGPNASISCSDFLSNYTYLSVNYSLPIPGGSVASYVRVYGIVYDNVYLMFLPGQSFYPISKLYPTSNGIRINNWNHVNSTITFTATNDIGQPCPDCPDCPTIEGTLDITENGTFDVSDYEFASVDVPPEPGDYDDEFESIRNAILICAGVALVIYFFYMIYGVLIGSSKR